MEKQELVLEIYNQLKDKGLMKVKNFEKNELVANFIRNRNNVYFILNGSCSLYHYQRNGDVYMHQRYDRYDSFGDIFHNIEVNSEQSVYANTKCSIAYFNYDDIIDRKDTAEVQMLLSRLFILEMKDMNDRIQVVIRKTIRDRILGYFDILSKRRVLKNFDLPMSYTQMASYLGVDRSAMMREILNLEKDRIIVRNKRKISFRK